MVGQGDLKQCPQVVFFTFDKRGRLSGFSVHAINSNMQTMKKAEHKPNLTFGGAATLWWRGIITQAQLLRG